SSATPLSALALAKLADMAGFPPGVFNVVTSTESRGIGEVFTQHPKVAKFSFTGSTEVGKELMAQCSSTVKRVSLELGGNAPFLVFDDADLDAAVQGALASKYRNAGQTCVCTNRFLVQRSVHDIFAEKFARAVTRLRVGNGLEPDVDIGPLISRAAVEEMDALVQEALAAGAELVVGGGPHQLGGQYYQPTIVKNVRNNMALASREIFGPVAPLIVFDTEEEGIALANDTRFGLAAYLYSRDVGRVWRVAEDLEYGMVGINEGIISNAAAPFGGVKESGLGREGSQHGMDEYLELKYLCLGGIDADSP
ncbi:MAG: aldehyde dehydrogenase family protein, partial [Desulfobulbaceae bacterium]|nr:aldehyde dehydrogenase family protein [Desulfobulbaceae bacterium]